MSLRTRVTDLRGRAASYVAAPVLLDPTNRRARYLRAAGRVVGSLFLVWLCSLVLAGLGLLPVSDVPLSGSVRVAQEPARLNGSPAGRAPAAADLRPARPLGASRAARTAGKHAAASRHGARADWTHAVARRAHSPAHHSSGSVSQRGTHSQPVAPGSAPQGRAAPTSGAAGSSGTTTTTHGRGRASGSSSSGGSGSSASTSPHGSSGSAPGHDPTWSRGDGNPPPG